MLRRELMGIITSEVTHEALQLLNIDHLGLDEIDRRILQTIIEKFGGGPVGFRYYWCCYQ